MAKAAPGINSFNAGELSPLLDSRTDKEWYQSGCKSLINFIPLVQGPAMRDPGTKFISEIKNSANRSWFGKFDFSAYEAYVLEFGDGYIRFFTDRGRLTISAPTAWSNATAYVPGDLALSGGVNYYCTLAHTNHVPPNSTYWYALTGSIYEIPTPYAVADLTGTDGECTLRIAQMGDQLYITHSGGLYEPIRISRYSDSSWVLEKMVTDSVLEAGPFEDQNKDTSVTVYSSATTGATTLTASSAIFTTGHVGGLFYLERKSVDSVKQWEPAKAVVANDIRRSNGKNYKAVANGTTGYVQPNHNSGTVYDGDAGVQWEFLDPGYGWVKITGFTSSTVVTGTVISRIPENAVGVGNPSHRWAFGRFSIENGWPENVAFFRERLVFTKEQTILASVAGDFVNFNKYNEGGQVTIEQAYTGTITSDQVDKVHWIVPSTMGLLLGTNSGELMCSEIITSAPFGPGNVKVEPKTGEGSRGIQPAKIGDVAVFVQRSGRKVRSFSINQDGYESRDLSVRNDQITLNGVIDMAWQKEPWSVLWCVTSAGELIGLTYNKEQEVIGWHRHTLGGTNPVVEAVQCIASPTNNRDDLYLLVKRTINGSTKRYVEYLVPEYQTGDGASSPFYVRCGLTYTGAAISTVSGLSHLEGQTVAVLADGATHPDCVVAAGAITLQRSASVIHVGLPYTSTLKTMRLEAGAANGTAQGKIKRITHAIVRFFNTLGAKAGPRTDNLDEILFRSGSDPMDAAPPIFTGDKKVPWPGGSETDGHLVIVQDQPLPMTVVGIYPDVTTQDGG